jgi:hypothetical protein
MNSWLLSVVLVVVIAGGELYVLARIPRMSSKHAMNEALSGTTHLTATSAPVSSTAPFGYETHDDFETAFRADHPVAKSHDLEQRLAQGARAALPTKSTLRNVECRSMHCRVETAHSSLDEFIEFVDRAFLGNGTPLTTGPVYSSVLGEPRAGEPTIAVAYVVLDSSILTRTVSRDPPE